MTLIHIDDPDDPRVSPYRDIRERDLVGRQNRFIAEGRVVLDALLASPRFEAESLLLLENRVPGLEATLSKVPPGLPVYVASRQVIDAIAGFPLHRGIMALGRRKPVPDALELLAAMPRRALVLVLVGIANHDNIGSIFRNAAAFGADAVFLDASCCDPLYRKSIRVSVGAALRVPYATFADEDDFHAALAAHGFDAFALSPRGARDLREVAQGERTALYLGTEGPGLPGALLECMTTLRIAMRDGFDSLNVAAASAVAMHHFLRE